MNNLLKELRENDIRVNVSNGELKLKLPKGFKKMELITQVKENKLDLIRYIHNLQNRNKFQEIPVAPKKEAYVLSSAQKRQYFTYKLNPNSTAYNMPGCFWVDASVNKEHLESCFLTLMNRHEALRTQFFLNEDIPMQRVIDTEVFSLEYYQGTEEEIDNRFAQFIRPFDLENGYPFRLGLMEIDGSRPVLFFDMHHIISDAHSQKILIEEFQSIYLGEQLIPLRLQYKDFAEWEQHEDQQGLISRQKQYWLHQFAHVPEVIDLPTDFRRPKEGVQKGNNISFAINAEQTQMLRELSKELDVSMFIMLIALYQTFLSKITNQEDIVIGAPIAGKDHPNLEPIVGMFVNVLPLRSKPIWEKKFSTFLKEVKETVLNAFEYQLYPYDELIDKLSLERDASRNPLFDVTFSYFNNVEENTNTTKSNFIEVYHSSEDEKTAKFDLGLTAVEEQNEILISLDYCTDLFKEESANNFVSYFQQVIQGILNDLDTSIANISVLTEERLQQIVFERNATETSFPKEKNIAQLFYEQVEKTPESIALHDGVNQWTYAELNHASNVLVSKIQEKYTVKINDPIGLLFQPSSEMMIAILAILKLGATYVPIDPDNPEIRNRYIVEDANIKFLISHESLKEVNTFYKGSIFYISQENLSNEVPVSSYVSHAKGSDLVYIMYTSGSTGKPKGTLISHMNISRVVLNTNYIDIRSNDKILQLSNYAFDGSVFGIYGALLNGAELHFIEKEVGSDVKALSEKIETVEVSILFITTAYFNVLVDYALPKLKNIRKVLFGGEQVSFTHVEKALDFFGKDVLIHVYGPTESTVFATYHPVNSVNPELGTVPIGVPISNTQIYVLDKYLNIVPDNVTGELYIGGDGLAKGYLNNPELTDKSFIDHPFISNRKVYKTGDLVKRQANGNIVFVGRKDHQIKNRGFRIELGEIESSLLEIDQVDQCLVTMLEQTNQDKRLVAYVVGNTSLSQEDLRSALKVSLPYYMIPSDFILMDTFPLTINGKIDRKALPSLSEGLQETYIKPSTELEEKLVTIWSDILKMDAETIGVTSSFFELGGHSLSAITLMNRIEQYFSVSIDLRDIFRFKDIQSLSAHVSALETKEYEGIGKAEEASSYVLSSAQRRMYFLYEFDKEGTTYNMPGVFQLDENLDVERFKHSIQELVMRHESLRTLFEIEPSEVRQKIGIGEGFELTHETLSNKELDKYIESFIRPFDLSREYPFRVSLVQLEEGGYILLLDMHHIISDGLSQDILLRDFVSLYLEESLPALELQYKDYAVWQQSSEQQARVLSDKLYWMGLYREDFDVLELPTDRPRPLHMDNQGGTVSITLKENTSKQLRSLALANDTTLYTVLLSFYTILLSKLGNTEDVIVGTPTSGRHHVI